MFNEMVENIGEQHKNNTNKNTLREPSRWENLLGFFRLFLSCIFGIADILYSFRTINYSITIVSLYSLLSPFVSFCLSLSISLGLGLSLHSSHSPYRTLLTLFMNETHKKITEIIHQYSNFIASTNLSVNKWNFY